MFKKLREKSKNKKGFTMVELIVVIVIILVLAGAMVPSLMKYVETAKKANCKADGATLLAQLQADYVAGQEDAITGTNPVTDTYTYSGVTVKPEDDLTKEEGKKSAAYKISDTNEISSFSYYDGDKYTATWTAEKGTWEVTPK